MITLALFVACTTTAPPAEAPPAEAPVAEDHHAKTEAPEAPVIDGWQHYGTPVNTKVEAVNAKVLLDDPAAVVDQEVTVTGTIDKVCQKAGCWMVLADDDGRYLRVTMKNHGFGVPTDTTTGTGTAAKVQGTLVAKTLDEATIEHLKSESTGTEEEKDKAFKMSYELVATGVALKRS